MANEESINMQLTVFCVFFVTLFALTECSRNILGGSVSSEINVVENLRVRGDHDHLKEYRPNQEEKIIFCSKECTPSLPCWCCDRRGRIAQCFPNVNDCNRYCA
uniref:uncharacterized protein LOC105351754 n=1 Tax=Fragaria vesca subsp. vesca TaxID=101020 RepID=UPI0005C912A0|nr:PREDICTED: uncharacterized protein LOC105351754 [Fragaria vesca subsp. vesca]